MRITLLFHCQNLTVVSLALACFFAVSINFSRAETYECEKAAFPNPMRGGGVWYETFLLDRGSYEIFFFDKEGKSIYATCSNGHVYRLDINEKTVSDLGKLLRENPGYRQLIDLHPNQNLLLVANGTDGESSSVVLWDLKSRSVAKQFEITDCNVPFSGVFFLNDGKRILVVAFKKGSIDRKFTILDTQSGKILQSKISRVNHYAVDKTHGNIALIEDTADSNNVQIYRNLNALPFCKISYPPYTFSDIIFTNDGTSFFHYNTSGNLTGMRRLSQKANDFTSTVPTAVNECAVSSNGKYKLLSCYGLPFLAFIDLSTAKIVAVPNLRGFTGKLIFSDNDKLCATTVEDGSIKVYDVDCLSRLCQTKGKVAEDLLQGLKKSDNNEKHRSVHRRNK